MGLSLKIKTGSNLQILWEDWQSLTFPRKSVNCSSVKRSAGRLLGWNYTVSRQHLQMRETPLKKEKRLKDNSFEGKNKDFGYPVRCLFPTAPALKQIFLLQRQEQALKPVSQISAHSSITLSRFLL